MPRTQTPATERAAQRAKAKDIASAIAGRPVTHLEAAAILRGDDIDDGTARRATTGAQRRNSTAASTRTPAADSIRHALALGIANLDTRQIATVLARVVDLKLHRGAVVTFKLEASFDFLHTFCDAALLDRGSLLVIHLAQYLPPPWSSEHADDDDDDDG